MSVIPGTSLELVVYDRENGVRPADFQSIDSRGNMKGIQRMHLIGSHPCSSTTEALSQPSGYIQVQVRSVGLSVDSDVNPFTFRLNGTRLQPHC